MDLTAILGPVRKRNYVADAAYVRRSLDDAPAAAPAKGNALYGWLQKLAELLVRLERLPEFQALKDKGAPAASPQAIQAQIARNHTPGLPTPTATTIGDSADGLTALISGGHQESESSELSSLLETSRKGRK